MTASPESIDVALQSADGQALARIFTGLGWSSLGSSEKRSLTVHIIRSFVGLPQSNQTNLLKNLDIVQALESALAHYSSTNTISSESYRSAADNALRKIMFVHFTQVGEFLQAASIYSSTRMGGADTHDENGGNLIQGDFSAAEKCDIFVSIAECYIAEDQNVEADSALQKAGLFVDKITDAEANWQIILRYKSNYANILDSNRKFLQASSRYHEVSQTSRTEIDPQNLLELLGNAATCAILSKSGPQRHHILALISKDERLEHLEQLPQFQNHSIVVTKMYKNHLLRKEELEIFEKSLQEHQRAVMSDGLTIMERAIIEHNMVAASKLYTSILFTELSVLLRVPSDKAEKIAAKMIAEGQLQGTIDQVDGILTFGEVGAESGLLGWDRAITDVCEEFNRVSDLIKGSA